MRIRGGVSLDGDEEGNRHRLDLGGKSSYERTVRGIGVLGKRPGLLQGALSVIDVESDPLSTYRAIEACGFQSVDFLFPHGTWERSEEHTSELQSLMRISYAVFCLKKKNSNTHNR